MILLPESEEKAMLALWRCGGSAVFYTIQQQLDSENWAASTLLNLFYRLEKKGFVRVEKEGGRNRYHALVRQREYSLAQGRAFLDRLWGGSLEAFVRQQVENRTVSLEELEKLEQYLQQALVDRYSSDQDLYDPWNG